MKNYIQLHENDNIIIALTTFELGSIIKLNNQEIVLKEAIGFGHKIAIKKIAINSKVLKYGLSIGSATQDITVGEHVHSHNLTTDYLINNIK
ncbi:UxaA family hydrolase [uncultured Maribacter sp.]|uniref:UxaA family hydrolase n=1 Tax=uncultured Maribacter sp. TaxID=431308 RepID=UPI00261D2B7D|nr:UxaA family hydrolase [uncultured Maribacter sp.]